MINFFCGLITKKKATVVKLLWSFESSDRLKFFT